MVNTGDMSVNPGNTSTLVYKYMRPEHLPHIWCPGCGNGIIMRDVAPVEIAAQEGDKLAADLEVALALGVHDQVDIAAAVAQLLVGQAVELLGQRLQGLAEEGDVMGADAHLALLRAEHVAADADDVADVALLERVIDGLVHLVLAGVDLNAAGLILQVAEGDLAHAALAHQAAGNVDLGALEHVEAVLDLLRVVGDVVLRDVEGVVSLVLQRLELLAAHLQDLTQILLFVLLVISCLLCHSAVSLLV